MVMNDGKGNMRLVESVPEARFPQVFQSSIMPESQNGIPHLALASPTSLPSRLAFCQKRGNSLLRVVGFH